MPEIDWTITTVVMVATVAVIGATRPIWKWGKVSRFFFVVACVAAGIAAAGYWRYSTLPERQVQFAGFKIGTDRAQLIYRHGLPRFVLAAWPEGAKPYQNFKGVVSPRTLENERELFDYPIWGFEPEHDGKHIVVQFEDGIWVREIVCMSISEVACPGLYGVTAGLDEAGVAEWVGEPSTRAADGRFVELEYPGKGLWVRLIDGKVAM